MYNKIFHEPLLSAGLHNVFKAIHGRFHYDRKYSNRRLVPRSENYFQKFYERCRSFFEEDFMLSRKEGRSPLFRQDGAPRVFPAKAHSGVAMIITEVAPGKRRKTPGIIGYTYCCRNPVLLVLQVLPY